MYLIILKKVRGNESEMKEMLLVPGPCPVVDFDYDAMASETRGHTDPRFVAIYKNAYPTDRKNCSSRRGSLRRCGIWNNPNGNGIVLNTVRYLAEKILAVSQGYFGDRFSQLGQAFRI